MSFSNHPVMNSVRKALGRSATPTEVPSPPELDEHIIRLVQTDFGLPELFAARAKENKMHVHFVSPEEVADAVVAKAKELGITSMVYPVSPLLSGLEVPEKLKAAGVDLRRWDETTLDASYDVDAGLTDAWAAVAETGSIVIRSSPEHGKAISLVPAYHIAILEPRVFVPDLVDLFTKMSTDSSASNTILISGPSKTSDIEMNLVVGVHGPCHVEVFILR